MSHVTQSPLGHVAHLFQAHVECLPSGTSPSQALQGFHDKQTFENYLSNQDFSTSIPRLCKSILGKVPNHSLVTYRGLVQDIFDTEYYCAVYEEYNKKSNERKWILSKYKDTIVTYNGVDSDVVVDLEGPNSVIAERLALFCIPIPGETGWANNYFNRHDTIDDTMMASASINEDNAAQNRKRQSDDDTFTAPSTFLNSKRQVVSSNTSDTMKDADEIVQSSMNKFTYGASYDSDQISCVTKMYNIDSSDSIKLNDMIEVVGILSFEAAMDEDDTTNETGLSTAGCSMIEVSSGTGGPRIHGITYRKLCSSFPLLKPIVVTGGLSQNLFANIKRDESIFLNNANLEHAAITIGSRSREIRRAIINRLTKALHGDKLMAEYVLLVLISKVYSRSDGVMLGALTLNIYGRQTHDNVIAAVYEAIGLLMARCVRLSASTLSLNNASWMPERNEEANRITMSPIQVGPGTVVMVHESSINQVDLNQNGIKSVQALQSMVLLQKLPVQFSYYQVQIPTEASFIFISHEESSIINSDSDIIRVPLECGECADMDVVEDSVSIDDIRLWIVSTRELGEKPLDEEMLHFIEEDFVRSRQLNRDVTPSTFHNWLTLARLIAFSNGSNGISRVEWDFMRQLEAERERRISENTSQ